MNRQHIIRWLGGGLKHMGFCLVPDPNNEPDYILEGEEASVWITTGPLQVYVYMHEHGVTVELSPVGYADDPLASTSLHYDEAEEWKGEREKKYETDKE